MLWTPKEHLIGDITIIRVGNEYHLFTEQMPLDVGDEFTGTRTVGHAISKDMFHWEELPAAIGCGATGEFDAFTIYHMDVFVFEHKGRHYIIFMTHPGWGAPVMTTDPWQTAGDFYAVSENGWMGPYRQPEDEIVVAAHGDLRMGGERTVEGPEGDRYLYGWLVMEGRRDDLSLKLTHGLTVPTPKRIRFLYNGQMHVVYHEKIEFFPRPTIITPDTDVKITSPDIERWRADTGVVGKHLGNRTFLLLPGQYDHFIFSARIRFLRGERAGLIARADESASNGWQVIADHRFGRIEFGALGSDRLIDARRWRAADEVELKLVANRESIEIYADDRLMIHQVRYRETAGRVGYLIERGEAEFGQPRLLVFA